MSDVVVVVACPSDLARAFVQTTEQTGNLNFVVTCGRQIYTTETMANRDLLQTNMSFLAANIVTEYFLLQFWFNFAVPEINYIREFLALKVQLNGVINSSTSNLPESH